MLRELGLMDWVCFQNLIIIGIMLRLAMEHVSNHDTKHQLKVTLSVWRNAALCVACRLVVRAH